MFNLARQLNIKLPDKSQNSSFWFFCLTRHLARQGAIIILLFSFIYSCQPAPALCQDYTDKQIVEAIFKAEGGYKAQYLFGIRSVSYNSFEEAEKICYNTVRNNRKRYKDYGYKNYNTFLEFLASRYAPLNVNNDPNNLNQYWLKNVKYFLEKEND
jgi:hypothetical protein